MISPRPKRRCVTINGRQGQPDSWRHVCFFCFMFQNHGWTGGLWTIAVPMLQTDLSVLLTCTHSRIRQSWTDIQLQVDVALSRRSLSPARLRYMMEFPSQHFGEPSADNELSRDAEDGRIWPQPWTGTSAPPEGRADPWHALDMVSVGFCHFLHSISFHFSRRSLFWYVLILNDPYFLMIFIIYDMIYLWYIDITRGMMGNWNGSSPTASRTGEASLSVAAGGKWIRAALDAWGG